MSVARTGTANDNTRPLSITQIAEITGRSPDEVLEHLAEILSRPPAPDHDGRE